MNIKPQKGMQEYLPEAAAQRDRLMNIILETYTASGFTRIYTRSKAQRTSTRATAATTLTSSSA